MTRAKAIPMKGPDGYDMSFDKWVRQTGKKGNFNFDQRVRQEHVGHLKEGTPHLYGQEKWRGTLETNNRTEAERKWHASIAPVIENAMLAADAAIRAGKEHGAPPDTPTDSPPVSYADAEAALERWATNALPRARERWLDGDIEDDPWSPQARERGERIVWLRSLSYIDLHQRGPVQRVDEALVAALREEGILLNLERERDLKVVRSLRGTWRAIWLHAEEAISRNVRDGWTDPSLGGETPTPAPQQVRQNVAPTPTRGYTWNDACALAAKRKRGKTLGQGAVRHEQKVYLRFEAFLKEKFGTDNPPLAEITDEIISDFVDLLVAFPAHHSERGLHYIWYTKEEPDDKDRIPIDLRGKSFPEIARIFKKLIEQARIHHGFKKDDNMIPVMWYNDRNNKPIRLTFLTNESIAQDLGSLSKVFSRALSKTWITENPVTIEIPETRGKSSRKSLEEDDIKTIFRSTLYVGCLDNENIHVLGSHFVNDHRYWIFILALFTGCRPEELAQLERPDLKKVAIERMHKQLAQLERPDIELPDEISYIWIRKESEIPREARHKLGIPEKTIKNATSERKMPLHETIIKLGFLEYVESLPADEWLIFPKLKPKTPTRRRWAAEGKELNEFLRDIGITDTDKVFYSFRHAFEDACKNVGLLPYIKDALEGRTVRDDSSSALYGIRSAQNPSLLYACGVSRLKFPGFPEDLRPWSP